jgi:hypothetical protein
LIIKQQQRSHSVDPLNSFPLATSICKNKMFKLLLGLCKAAPEGALIARQYLAKKKKTFVPTTAVRRGHEFDATKLLSFLRAELGNDALPKDDSAIDVGQFAWGQSNPTFALKWEDGGKEQGLVVRKQPPGKLLKGAHDVAREYAAMTSLKPTPVPVPTTRLMCEDLSILGTPFFAYDYVPGRFFSDQYLASVTDFDERRAIYKAFAETLASLHSGMLMLLYGVMPMLLCSVSSIFSSCY